MLEYEFLQIAVGKRDCFSVCPSSSEWDRLYEFAQKQTLVGVLFSAIERLPKDQLPYIDLLMEWLGQAEYIKERNELVNKRTAEITRLFEKDGMRSCVLKGQANSRFYPMPGRRASGDIDLWVEGNRKNVAKYVIERRKDYTRMQFHHIDYQIFDDVAVEVHFRPVVLFNYWKNESLQIIFKYYSDICFKNWMPNGQHFCTLTYYPDILMQLAHMYRHIFDGGVGFRQLMDFYYLLLKAKPSGNKDLVDDLKRTGLYSFACAVSFVIKNVFNADDETLIVKPNKHRGLFLLKEVMTGGNFGHYDTRYTHKVRNKCYIFGYSIYRNLRLARYYPSDCVWNVIYRLSQYIWRVNNGWK